MNVYQLINNYSTINFCILYKTIKKKYIINDNFILSPLNKLDINLSDYYFQIDIRNNDIIPVVDKIRVYDSEDDIFDVELPNESEYDSNENVHCIYKYHISENDEKYEYYKKIFINNLIRILKYELNKKGLTNEIEIYKYIDDNPPQQKINSGLMQLVHYGLQDIINN
jgi:hypothetical protein